MSGTCVLDLGVLEPLALGDRFFMLEIGDGTAIVVDTIAVAVENSAPVVAPGGGGVFEIGSSAVEVTSNEPPDFDGDGNFVPDYEILEIDTENGIIRLELRAERSGKGDGRTYTVMITATDPIGNRSTASVEVKAPHDKRKR